MVGIWPLDGVLKIIPINESKTNTSCILFIDIIFYNFIAIVTENDFISRNFLQKLNKQNHFFAEMKIFLSYQEEMLKVIKGDHLFLILYWRQFPIEENNY